jgi:hypothetical protein
MLSEKPRIAVVALYGGDWPPALMSRVMKNKETYCQKHGYHFVNGNKYVDNSRPPAWSKLIAVKEVLRNYDYLMYIDMDAIIMDMSRPIEYFIAAGSDKDVIMTEDWGGPNTGVFICRNSSWTSSFFTEAWNQKQLVQPTTPDGKRYPFEYEQRAIHYLLDTEKWRSRDLPKYPGDIENNRNHVAYLPQCAFNAYSLHPFDSRGRWDETQV